MSETLKFGNGQWATKVGSTLAHNDENGNFKPLPFNFTRSTGATRVNKDGLIEVVSNNVPRIDFSNDVNGALLLEPERRNLFLYSESLETVWASSGTNPPVLTASQFISPDGSQNASRLQIPSTGTTSIFYQLFSHTIGTQYTISAYVKSNTSTNQQFKLYGDFGAPSAISGVLTATSEWQRFSFTYTATATGSRSGGFYYVPNTAADLQVYGIQVEVGSYSTSYIPTQGSAVTRVAEVCSQTNISTNIISSSYPFTMYVESENIYGGGVAMSFIDTSAADKYFNVSIINNVVTAYSRANSSLENIISGVTLTKGQRFKAAFTMESATSGNLSVNGNIVSKTTFANQAANVNINDLLLGQLRIVSDNGERLPLYDARLYNTLLTNTELQQLTTL